MHDWVMRFIKFSRWPQFAILDSYCIMLDDPRRCFDSPKMLSKFGNEALYIFWVIAIYVGLYFIALRGMQTRYSDKKAVRPSVRPSVRQTRELWQNGRKICPDFYTIGKIIYTSFLRRRLVSGGRHPSTWNFGSTGPRWSEIAHFQPIRP